MIHDRHHRPPLGLQVSFFVAVGSSLSCYSHPLVEANKHCCWSPDRVSKRAKERKKKFENVFRRTSSAPKRLPIVVWNSIGPSSARVGYLSIHLYLYIFLLLAVVVVVVAVSTDSPSSCRPLRQWIGRLRTVTTADVSVNVTVSHQIHPIRFYWINPRSQSPRCLPVCVCVCVCDTKEYRRPQRIIVGK